MGLNELSEMEIIGENYESGPTYTLPEKKTRPRNVIYPAVFDIEEKEERISKASEVRDSMRRKMVEKERCDKQEVVASMIVTSGGLIFLLVAAVIITAFFLISPVLETLLSEYYLRLLVSPYQLLLILRVLSYEPLHFYSCYKV